MVLAHSWAAKYRNGGYGKKRISYRIYIGVFVVAILGFMILIETFNVSANNSTLRFHCVFRLEMEHLLTLTGFEIEEVYGDFSREELTDEATEMVWVAKKRFADESVAA